MTTPQSTPRRPRVQWLDTCKAYAIILGFIGHLWPINLTPEALFPFVKLIYAFRMPLFFLLSGFLARTALVRFPDFMRDRFLTRLLPVLLFELLALLIHFASEKISGTKPSHNHFMEMVQLLCGNPHFNMVTWFLVCLFSVELAHFLLSPHLATPGRRWLAMALSFIIGLPFGAKSGDTLVNFWYLHEVPVALAFFLLGRHLKDQGMLNRALPRSFHFLGLMLTLTLLYFSFERNHHFAFSQYGVVLMILRDYGHPSWFLFSALVGSAALIFLAELTPRVALLSYIGQNALILMGLGGLFHQYFNPPLMALLPTELWTGEITRYVAPLAFGFASLLFCLPFVALFNHFLPQLVGRPRVQGPLLPRLLN